MPQVTDMPPTLPPDLQKLVVGPDQTIRDAMRVITDNWREIALVADAAGRVLGVVTDGDIRRGLLSGPRRWIRR